MKYVNQIDDLNKKMLSVFESENNNKPTRSQIETGQHQDLKGGRFDNKNTLEVNK